MIRIDALEGILHALNKSGYSNEACSYLGARWVQEGNVNLKNLVEDIRNYNLLHIMVTLPLSAFPYVDADKIGGKQIFHRFLAIEAIIYAVLDAEPGALPDITTQTDVNKQYNGLSPLQAATHIPYFTALYNMVKHDIQKERNLQTQSISASSSSSSLTTGSGKSAGDEKAAASSASALKKPTQEVTEESFFQGAKDNSPQKILRKTATLSDINKSHKEGLSTTLTSTVSALSLKITAKGQGL